MKHSVRATATGLMLLASFGLLACRKSPSSSPDSSTNGAGASETVFSNGKLRAVVIGQQLPFVTTTETGDDGLSFVVLEAIRDQLKTAAETKADNVSLETMTASSVDEGLNKIRNGEADIACGVGFSWERQKTLNYTLPFATSGIRVLAPAGIDGTPDSLKGQTIGVVKDSVAASILANSVDDASLQAFDTPSEALEALKSDKVSVLGGDTLWLRANQKTTAPDSNLVPALPYGRASVGCVVTDATPHLLNVSNLAIGRLLQAYINNDTDVRKEINRWVGPGSSIGLKDEQISTFFRIVLATVAEITPNN
jgi:polar amino acid transport system substrate-binding protein